MPPGGAPRRRFGAEARLNRTLGSSLKLGTMHPKDAERREHHAGSRNIHPYLHHLPQCRRGFRYGRTAGRAALSGVARGRGAARRHRSSSSRSSASASASALARSASRAPANGPMSTAISRPMTASAEAILDAAALYAATPDGLIPWRQRPDALKKGVVARIPPLIPPPSPIFRRPPNDDARSDAPRFARRPRSPSSPAFSAPARRPSSAMCSSTRMGGASRSSSTSSAMSASTATSCALAASRAAARKTSSSSPMAACAAPWRMISFRPSRRC